MFFLVLDKHKENILNIALLDIYKRKYFLDIIENQKLLQFLRIKPPIISLSQ